MPYKPKTQAGIVLFLIIVLGVTPLFETATAETEIHRRYEIKGKLDPTTQTLNGNLKISFKNDLDRQVKQVLFLVRPNLSRQKNPYLSDLNINAQYPQGFNPAWTRIKSVKSHQGKSVTWEWKTLPPALQTYSLERTLLSVEFDSPLEAGETAQLTIQFQTRFPYRQTADEGVYKETYTWRFGWHPLLTPSDWWPSENAAQKSKIEFPTANYTARITVPEGWEVLHSQKKTDDSEKTVTHTVKLPHARSLPLVTGPKYQRLSMEFKEIDIRMLFYAGYNQEARLFATYVKDILSYYSSRYGDYPRNHLTIVQSPLSGQFGLAADGVIILGDSFFSARNLALSPLMDRMTEYLLAHEVAHQWFGIGLGADLNAQNWISEAFSEYGAVSYFENKYEPNAGNLFQFEQEGFLRGAIESQLGYVNLRKHTFELPYLLAFQDGFDEAVIKPAKEVRYSNYSQVRTYKKGYLILRTVENAIGVENMSRFINRAFREFKPGFATVQDLENLAEEVADRKLDRYFDQWLFTDGFLDYGIRNKKTEKRSDSAYSTRITLFNRGQLSSEVLLRLEGREGQVKDRTLKPFTGTKTVNVSTDFAVRSVALDPNDMVMDPNRLNNHYPRKVEIAVTKNKMPLDAYLLQLGPSGVSGSVPGKHRWFIGTGIVRGFMDIDRNLSLSGALSSQGISEQGLDLEWGAGLHWKGWTHPNTGQTGKHWEQSRRASITFNRAQKPFGEPYHYVGIEGEMTSRVQDSWSISARSSLGLKGFGKLSVSARETISLIPQISLNLSSNLGVSFGDLPPQFKFRLPELHSYGRWKTDLLSGLFWEEANFSGNYKLHSKIELTLPFARDIRYYLGNLALVTDVYQSTWLQVGNVWNSPENTGLEDLKWEIGLEATVRATTLGGLLPVETTVGYAYHGAGTGHQFINIKIGF